MTQLIGEIKGLVLEIEAQLNMAYYHYSLKQSEYTAGRIQALKNTLEIMAGEDTRLYSKDDDYNVMIAEGKDEREHYSK